MLKQKLFILLMLISLVAVAQQGHVRAYKIELLKTEHAQERDLKIYLTHPQQVRSMLIQLLDHKGKVVLNYSATLKPAEGKCIIAGMQQPWLLSGNVVLGVLELPLTELKGMKIQVTVRDVEGRYSQTVSEVKNE